MIQPIPYHRGDEPEVAVVIEPSLAPSSEVGLAHFLVTDAAREDASTGIRQFLISAFYPALANGERVARLSDLFGPPVSDFVHELAIQAHLTLEEVQQLQKFASGVSLQCRNDAALSPQAANCPILIYYPGGQAHRLSNAVFCRRLAERGYVVLALDAPRDAPFVVYPDGRAVAQGMLADECYIWPRVADIRCLLDALPVLQSSGLFRGRLNLQKIGMAGHSRGGYLSNITAVEDQRVSAAVNMDGFLWGFYDPGETGLRLHSGEFREKVKTTAKPLLRLCGEQESGEAAEAQFKREAGDWPGNLVYCSLAGFSHATFGSIPWLNGELKNLKQSTRQPAPAQRTLNLPGAIVGEFFGRHFGANETILPAEIECQVQAYFSK